MTPFEDLFSRHVATALARQLALADHLGDRDWQLDLTEGTATFGGDLRYRVQLLGTESHHDGTWLWAWANEASNLPPALLGLAMWMREYGANNGIPELTEASFPLDRAQGGQLALVASALSGRCYYRGPYDGGALFFHLEGLPAEIVAPARPERVLTVVGQVLQGFPVDHRLMVTSFLAQQGWQVEDTPAEVTGRHPGGTDVRVAFDELGRVTGLTGSIQPG
ncbi:MULTISPECIES: DUF6882 domain-containing protein [Catenuloplanes]|uniref:Uncharacterized protein n=1 Tax=Catenuloplanes niger TaxID=587534 RepID=A0AAE3ZMD4_9ACTN|nr:DUF6882 domain-containing protein [Catenuloplanes niger]MDR7320520.1 hypothetical protein [Catenuloplanes niger]